MEDVVRAAGEGIVVSRSGTTVLDAHWRYVAARQEGELESE